MPLSLAWADFVVGVAYKWLMAPRGCRVDGGAAGPAGAPRSRWRRTGTHDRHDLRDRRWCSVRTHGGSTCRRRGSRTSVRRWRCRGWPRWTWTAVRAHCVGLADRLLTGLGLPARGSAIVSLDVPAVRRCRLVGSCRSDPVRVSPVQHGRGRRSGARSAGLTPVRYRGSCVGANQSPEEVTQQLPRFPPRPTDTAPLYPAAELDEAPVDHGSAASGQRRRHRHPCRAARWLAKALGLVGVAVVSGIVWWVLQPSGGSRPQPRRPAPQPPGAFDVHRVPAGAGAAEGQQTARRTRTAQTRTFLTSDAVPAADPGVLHDHAARRPDRLHLGVRGADVTAAEDAVKLQDAHRDRTAPATSTTWSRTRPSAVPPLTTLANGGYAVGAARPEVVIVESDSPTRGTDAHGAQRSEMKKVAPTRSASRPRLRLQASARGHARHRDRRPEMVPAALRHRVARTAAAVSASSAVRRSAASSVRSSTAAPRERTCPARRRPAPRAPTPRLCTGCGGR